MVIGTLESHLAGPFISMQVTGIEIFTRLWWLLLRTIPEWPGGGRRPYKHPTAEILRTNKNPSF